MVSSYTMPEYSTGSYASIYSNDVVEIYITSLIWLMLVMSFVLLLPSGLWVLDHECQQQQWLYSYCWSEHYFDALFSYFSLFFGVFFICLSRLPKKRPLQSCIAYWECIYIMKRAILSPTWCSNISFYI